VLLEEGGAFSDTKHYLYGRECIGEHVDADDAQNNEWRHYQRDTKSMVRQTSDEERQVTMAWTYSPTGGVLLGEKGPVTYLDCGDNAIYDWSTELIFKRGKYFDPANGLWITLSGVVVWQAWPPDNRSQRRRKHRNSKRNRKWILLLLLLLIVLLAGCGNAGGTSTPTPCPITPTATPTIPPTLPSPTNTSLPPTETPIPPTPTATNAPTNTSTNTPTLTPTGTPTGTPTPTPTPGTVLWESSPISGGENGLPDWLQWYGLTVRAKNVINYNTIDGAHPGLDLGVNDFQAYEVSGDTTKGIPVKSGVSGSRTVAEVGPDSSGFGRVKISMPGQTTAFYDHLLLESIQVKAGDSVGSNDILGYLADPSEKHLHLELRKNIDNAVTNPFPYFHADLQIGLKGVARRQPQQDIVTYPTDYEYGDPAIQPDTYHNR
jgi:murein DD-endopeptidase MepM/ murein hydrolase activator NlpD